MQEYRTLYGPRMRPLRTLILLLTLGVAMCASATHNRAGEIIVCHLGGLEYRITVITHTKLSAPADRPELEINYGDSPIQDTILRTDIDDFPDQDLRRSEYVTTHTYTGYGEFVIMIDDMNRNGGVINVPNSIAQSFSVRTLLRISPVTGRNNCSAQFLNSPIQDACLNQPWVHNPAAFDPDGDSLSFEPAICLGRFGLPIPGYSYPGPSYSIDPITGTISWNAPPLVGEYNIAFIVREWRLVNGVWREVGYVMRDMQITVRPCNNQPPVIQARADTCVVAGTLLNFTVQASDPNATQAVTLEALGQPFELATSPATFLEPTAGNPVNGIFNWNTQCAHVRSQPYMVVFNATDNWQPVQLQAYGTMMIKVVGPAPQNPMATPVGNTIALQWDQSICSNAVRYLIYRRSGPYGFTPDHCELGVPAYTGYTLIGTNEGLGNTSYTDDADLVIGNSYCYMVVAVFPDGAQSYASVEFCAMLDRQVPVITKVSVGTTDVSAGIDTVRWSNAYDLDTIARPGPYRFNLYRGTGLTTATELIWTSSVHPFLAHPDTGFIDTGLDTEAQPHVYRVELIGRADQATPDVIGSSSPASSVFIATTPDDEQLTIAWSLNTPWTNSSYEVFRDVGGSWVSVGTSTTTSFVDTGLVNGQEYCYLVISTGAYSDPSIGSPLLNWSQEVCGIPVDRTPPCAPSVSIENDCEKPLNTLTWNNPNDGCADDTHGYRIYFTDSIGGVFQLIAVVDGAENTMYQHVDGSSVAGCYQVTAVDTVGNESAFVAAVCGDNCPGYTLPNVFTPNGDGHNDRFGPFPYRGVERIDLQVFNRWGKVVFRTEDPDIEWKGTYLDSDSPLPDGVYYYLCQVTYIRLAGKELVELKGYVHIQGGNAQGNVH